MITIEKHEYIRQIKYLLKKYHPDKCNDENQYELFHEISIRLTAKLDQLNTKQIVSEYPINILETENTSKAIIAIAQDYALYKVGIKYYKKIHPSYFYKTGGVSSLFSGFEKHCYEKQLELFREMLDCFYMSELYFKRLIENYPTSIWKEDAIEKIEYLSKLKARYYKMEFDND